MSRTLPNGDRSGFCLGDGPGVGKTRVVAVILSFCSAIFRSCWFSANRSDNSASADEAMGARVEASKLTTVQGDQRNSPPHMTLQQTFMLLDLIKGLCRVIGGRMPSCQKPDLKQSDLDGTVQTRSGWWCSPLTFSKKLPNARILYVTGTLADEPEHLGQTVACRSARFCRCA